MNNDMIRKGICTNFQNCEIADSQKVVEVGLTEDFVCPNLECGNDLKEVKPTGGNNKLKYIIGGVVVAGIIAGASIMLLSNDNEQPKIAENPPATTVDEVTSPINTSDTSADDDISSEPEDNKTQADESSNTEQVQTPPVTPPTTPPDPKPAKSTITVTGGRYNGEVKNGKPDGQGTLTYTTRTRISMRDMKERYAEAGQYVIGEFHQGELVQGKLYDTDNTPLESLILGRPN